MIVAFSYKVIESSERLVACQVSRLGRYTKGSRAVRLTRAAEEGSVGMEGPIRKISLHSLLSCHATGILLTLLQRI